MSDCNENSKVTITPIESCPYCDGAEMPSYAITVDELTQLRERVAKLEAALRSALDIIAGLSEQQAMTDDWWMPDAAKAREALEVR